MTADPKTLVTRFYAELWDAGDESVAWEILAEDFRFRGSLGPERLGVDGFLGYWRDVRAALAEYRSDIETLVIERDKAAARMTFSGRHVAPFFGISATDKRIGWSGAAFFTFADGQIASLWVLGDIDAVRRQLGAPSTATF